MNETGRMRRVLFAAVFAAPLSLCLVLGYQLEKDEHVTPGLPGVAFFLLLTAVLTAVTALSFTMRRPRGALDKNEGSAAETGASGDPAKTDSIPAGRENEAARTATGAVNNVHHKRDFLITWGCIAVPNLVVLLGVYPGFFVYDAQDELMEVVTRSFNTHHPLLHVLAMGGTITGVHKFTDSWNLGIFVYLLLQMLFITAVYALMLTRLRTRGLSPRLKALFTLWYGFFPTVVMYTLCSTKDGPFSAFTALFVLGLYELLSGSRGDGAPESTDAENVKKAAEATGMTAAADVTEATDAAKAAEAADSTKAPSSLVPAGAALLLSGRLIIPALLMMLFRNNACYALIVFSALLLVPAIREWLRTRRGGQHDQVTAERSKMLCVIITSVILSILLFSLFQRALILGTHASHNEHQEAISVVIQSLGRIWVYHPEILTEEDRAVLLTYLDEAALDHYDPHNVDLLKATFNNDRYETDSASFWKLWFRAARRVPATVLNSWLLTSYGLWYPFAVNNPYAGHEVFTFTYTESSYFGYETELPGVRNSLIPPIDALYRWLSLDATIQRIPLLSLLFAPAFYFWLYAWFAVRWMYQKRERRLMPFAPLFLLWMTYLIGPYWLIRYMLPFFTALPVLSASAAADPAHSYHAI